MLMRSTILAFLVLSCTSFAQCETPATLDLSGADWRIHEDADGKGADRGMADADATSADWIPAAVPGNIQSDLETAHQLKPLWYGAVDPRLEKVAQKDWWYRKDFRVPESFKDRRVTLVFDGVDHECDVWFNGRKIGGNIGMFRRFQFDVTKFAEPGTVNRLAVRITRIPEALVPLVTRTDGQGVVNNATHFLRGIQLTPKILKEFKSPTNWGWDWGTNIWTLGIWKDVRLEATGPARIDWSRVQTSLNDNFTKATVTATLEIDSSVDLSAKAQFRITGQGQKVNVTVNAALKKGRNLVKAELPLDQPALWWPNGQGDQPLYNLRAEVQPVGGGPASDVRNLRFGVRDLQWVHTEGAPADFISRYQLIINGRPVRTIGSNLMPPDLLFGRMGPRALNLIRRAKDAGANTFRIWGGGVILHDQAYDLADELGIMLVLELPLANNMPETDPESLANLETTMRNIVKQVRNHPSIIELDGGNEMPWRSTTKHPALQLLQKIVAEEDGRLFRATCPDLGASHSPYFIDLRRDCRSVDARVTMRLGEFGSSSPANLEVWHRDIPPKSQWPIEGVKEPIQIHKNIVQAVFVQDFWLRKTFLEGVFGPFDDLPEMVEAGQFYGAEGLRYAVDAMRRKGRRIGGLTTWDFNEPWTNGAGSYLVDYDGRTLMSYDFFKQAVAPISLSLKYDSVFYRSESGVKAELFLTSDAPRLATDLRWKWTARDRRGRVFAHNEGTASIRPIEVKSLGAVELKPPPKTAFGPVLVEMRLDDASGKLLAERIHVFVFDSVTDPLAGLLKNRGNDSDDDAAIDPSVELPDGPANLAFVGNGAKPATASSARPGTIHQPKGLNDGVYGNNRSWIGAAPRSSFQIDLGKTATVGRFKLGRDRTRGIADRGTDYLKIETSLDGHAWQTVFEKTGITSLPGFSPTKTLAVHIAPVQAKFVKATVDSKDPAGGELACIDEFEVYAPAKQPPAATPSIALENFQNPTLWRPVRRTTLHVKASPTRVEGDREVLELQVQNTGPMTALFCEPHPLVEYRTDLFIDNNHCFIPPGESRTIVIKASKTPAGGLSLAQTGWRVSCWNADNVVIEPSDDVLLAVGRRDAMCREFFGYFDVRKAAEVKQATLEGIRPDTSKLPYWLDNKKLARFEFPLTDAQAKRPARLRIHAADQSKDAAAVVEVSVNGTSFEQTLPKGLGIQNGDPAHLAFPATLVFQVPQNVLRPGKNAVEVRVKNGGWFSWDSMDFIGHNQ